MKTHTVYKITACFFAGLLILLTTACATSDIAQKADNSGFEYYELKNGIPLIVKQNTASSILSLQITVKGGSALMTPEESGLEGSLFSMMTMGSENYDYASVQQILYEKQAGFYSGADKLGSALGLVTIDYYFDDLLPLLIDGFLHPAFGEEEYTTLMTSIAQSLQAKQEDPYTLLFETIAKTRYKNHPYETDTSATPESYENITIPAMQAHLNLVLNAERIAVIAVGNFDGKDLVKKLNATLGELPSAPFDVPLIPPASEGGEPIVLGVEAAKGSGYLASTVPAPLPGTPDEIAAHLAAQIYREILFNLVREQYGATYSIGTSYVSSKAPYIVVNAYKVSDSENIVSRINEAQSLMTEGKIISGKNDETGEYEYTTIEERLEGFKNALINSQFYSSQTNAAIAGKIQGGLLMFDDAENYLEFTDRVHAVTAADIQRVFNTYWLSDEKQWFAVTGPGEEDLLKFE